MLGKGSKVVSGAAHSWLVPPDGAVGAACTSAGSGVGITSAEFFRERRAFGGVTSCCVRRVRGRGVLSCSAVVVAAAAAGFFPARREGLLVAGDC
jgi:hypothetical protein